jgi:hypothetical protein
MHDSKTHLICGYAVLLMYAGRHSSVGLRSYRLDHCNRLCLIDTVWGTGPERLTAFERSHGLNTGRRCPKTGENCQSTMPLPCGYIMAEFCNHPYLREASSEKAL